MQRMMGGSSTRAGGAAVLLSVLLVGCAVEADDRVGQVETSTSPGSAGGVTDFDFSCRDQPLPARASDALSLSGFTNDSYSGGPLSDVAVDLLETSGAKISTTWSDDSGRLAFALSTDNRPIYSYARMSRPGHVTSYLYPSGPLTEDQVNVFFPVLPPTWRAELAGYAGVELDATRGIVGVIVTDCAGERVDGATVTFDPPAEAIAYWDPTFTDASGTVTSINGHAWGFNVPAGEVHATVTIGDVTYRDWPVQSFADGRTLSWRAP
jgi:hypothetical protein